MSKEEIKKLKKEMRATVKTIEEEKRKMKQQINENKNANWDK